MVKKITLLLLILCVGNVFSKNDMKNSNTGNGAIVPITEGALDSQKTVISKPEKQQSPELAQQSQPANVVENDNSLKKIVKTLTDSLKVLMSENVRLKQANEQLEKKQDVLQQLNIKLQNDAMQFEIVKKQLEKDTEGLQKLNVKLQKDSIQFEIVKKQYEKKHDVLQQTNTKLQNDIEQLEIGKKRLEQDTARLQKSNIKLQKDSVQLERVNKQLEQEKTQLQQLINDAIVSNYKQSFDTLVTSSTKQSLRRDMRFININSEEGRVLADLKTYFVAKELLAQKYNAGKVSEELARLNQIKRQSQQLDALKENIERYKDCNDALKKVIDELIKLDGRISAVRVPEAQKIKYKEVSAILGEFMYRNSDYVNFSYLSNIVHDLLRRKGLDADVKIEEFKGKL